MRLVFFKGAKAPNLLFRLKERKKKNSFYYVLIENND